MRCRLGVIRSLTVLAIGATSALAVTDDLQCFTVKNDTLKRLKAVVDLSTPSVGSAPGCKLSKAMLYCLPTETAVRPGTVFDGRRPTETLSFVGPPAESARICYRMTCKNRKVADQQATDQFGAHAFKKVTTSMLCRAAVGADSFCGDAQRTGTEQCDGGDLGGRTCESLGLPDGILGCTGMCTYDTSLCVAPSCGDGRRTGAEQCDGADLGGASCQSLGIRDGTLGCTGTCAYDTSECVPGFSVTSPDIPIQGGQIISYCYFFRTPNTEQLAIKSWASQLTVPARRALLFLTATDVEPPGSLVGSGCGFGGAGGGGLDVPVWTYSGTGPTDQFVFPSDDGSGTPVGQILPPNQPAILVMEFANQTLDVVTSRVRIDATGYAPGRTVTRADPYHTFNGNISIPPMSSKMHSFSCPVPPGAKFVSLSMYAHKQAVHTFVKDGATVAFESTDFENPGRAQFTAPGFFAFGSGMLTYQCDYVNPTNRTITTGPSLENDEVCSAVGFYFPGAGAKFCFNNFLTN